MKSIIKTKCIQCKKIKMIESYSGRCNACINPHAKAMGKLSAKARKKIHTRSYYQEMGKKSAKLRKSKTL